MYRFVILAALAAMPAMAQQSSTPPNRIRSVVIVGDEKCPDPVGDEVVVCSRPGDEPYRIPKEFREEGPIAPANQSWARRVELIDEVNRSGMPNSCSTVGTGGQTGCTALMLRQWRAEQREKAEGKTPVR